MSTRPWKTTVSSRAAGTLVQGVAAFLCISVENTHMRLSNERTLRAPTTRTDDDAHATHVCVCACTYAHAHTHSRMHRRASQHMHRIQRRQHNTTRAGPAGARAFVIDAVATVSSLPFEYRSSTDRVRAGAPVIHPGHPPAITPVRDQTLASSGNGRNVSRSAPTGNNADDPFTRPFC